MPQDLGQRLGQNRAMSPISERAHQLLQFYDPFPFFEPKYQCDPHDALLEYQNDVGPK